MSRMNRRRASRIRCIVLVLASAAAGACSAPTYYDTAADFEDAIRTMAVLGEPLEKATARLASRGFDCGAAQKHRTTCGRVADNVLCAQRQVVTLVNRPDKGHVDAFEIVRAQDAQRLPGQCM
ncbi:MAG: hypothetical protein ABW051_05095 [Burkholderiaceae bacterium]